MDDVDTFTQFSYACHQLGVDIKTSSVPQAKGRIERLNQTLQSRLPVELRIHGIRTIGIRTIEEANIFLNSYIKNIMMHSLYPFIVPKRYLKSNQRQKKSIRY